MNTVDEVVAAIEAGELVVIPTDTVYGLACRPDREDAVRALSTLKRRSPEQPIALVASGVEPLLELIPELPVAELVRGAFTLVVPNPARRLPWLGGAGTIGVRIPEVTGLAAELLARVGVVAATSANLHGGRGSDDGSTTFPRRSSRASPPSSTWASSRERRRRCST